MNLSIIPVCRERESLTFNNNLMIHSPANCSKQLPPSMLAQLTDHPLYPFQDQSVCHRTCVSCSCERLHKLFTATIMYLQKEPELRPDAHELFDHPFISQAPKQPPPSLLVRIADLAQRRRPVVGGRPSETGPDYAVSHYTVCTCSAVSPSKQICPILMWLLNCFARISAAESESSKLRCLSDFEEINVCLQPVCEPLPRSLGGSYYTGLLTCTAALAQWQRPYVEGAPSVIGSDCGAG